MENHMSCIYVHDRAEHQTKQGCSNIVYQDHLCWRHSPEHIRRANPGGHTVYGSHNFTGARNKPMSFDEWREGADAGKYWPSSSPCPADGFKFIPPPPKVVLLRTMVKEAEAKGPAALDAFLESQGCETLGKFVLTIQGPVERAWDKERGVLPKDAPDMSVIAKRMFSTQVGKSRGAKPRTQYQPLASSSAG
jgi:hypothetical protein